MEPQNRFFCFMEPKRKTHLSEARCSLATFLVMVAENSIVLVVEVEEEELEEKEKQEEQEQ